MTLSLDTYARILQRGRGDKALSVAGSLRVRVGVVGCDSDSFKQVLAISDVNRMLPVKKEQQST